MDDWSSDNEEEFHSTRETPRSLHGDLGPRALIQLVVAYVALHQRAKSQHRTRGLSPYPIGLPRFPVKKKGKTCPSLHPEGIADCNLHRGDDALEKRSSSDGSSRLMQTNNVESLPTRSKQETCHASHMVSFSSSGTSHTHKHQQPCNASSRDISSPMKASFASTQEQPWNALAMENLSSFEDFALKIPTEETHSKRFPLLKRTTRVESTKDSSSNVFTQYDEEDGSVYSPVKVSMDEHLDRGYLKECRPKRRSMKRELDLADDGEDLSCAIDAHQDGGASSSILGRENWGCDEEGLRVRRIADTDLSTIRELPEESSVSSNFEKTFSISPLARHEKRQPPYFDYDVNEGEDIQIGKQEVDENLEICHRNIASCDGSDLKDSKLHTNKDLKISTADQMPEEGQLDSLLLWPVGLAIEAITFQVRLVAHAFALIALVYNWCNSFASSRVRETLQAKERATEALSQKVAIISNVPPKVTESGSIVLKRAAWGCFAATYVCILLSMLLFPALLLDYVFLSRIVEEPVSVREPLYFDYTLPHPTSVVFVQPSKGLQNSISEFGSHQEHARVIPISYKVHITVILTLPESDYNRNLGMFQLSAELLSEDGQSIKSSSRACMLRFHSVPIRMLKTFLVSLPSLVGVFTESQTLVVHLMEFEEQHVATNAVRILLQPKAGMPLGQGIPQLYSADVHIESHLPWLKNLLRNWKWTVYIWTGLMLYVVEVTMVLCCCRQALLPKTWMGLNDEGKAEQLGGNTPAEVHESGSLDNRLLRKRRQRSLNEHIPTARAILDRREHKLSQGGSNSSL